MIEKGDSFMMNDYSILFSSLPSTTESKNTFDLSEYASIKNGSYVKLLKAYYAQQEEEEKSSAAAKEKESLTPIKSGADDLEASASALTRASLWEKKTVKNADGTETTDYDWDAITKALEDFAKDYNNVVKLAGDSNTKSVLRYASWMTGMTRSNDDLLASVGIKLEDNNTLTIDADKVKSSNIASLKSIFLGAGSIADRIAQKAGSIANAATINGTYTKSGKYSESLSKLVSGSIDEEV